MNIIVLKQGDGWQAALGEMRWRCSVGRSGVVSAAEKREGDGASPEGCWPLRKVYYRADRVAPPSPHFSCIPIERHDGWCDDAAHPLYNQQVRLPFAASHEELWRDDHVYDVIGVLGYNDDPVAPGKGSAIFLHIAKPDYGPTAGCAALALGDLLQLLAHARPGTSLCFRRER
ncbi:L,D-transpeptidase family protein [Aestuariivirga sp.]|uniref:L,D-transpeptidase family protein n=1 Tax=Aestuariivirga sp. TaxID=2650926 RepID=UPI0039E7175F